MDDQTIRAVNDLKGQITALQTMLCAVLRVMPSGVRQQVGLQWRVERELATTALMHSNAPDDVLDAFAAHVELLATIAAIQLER